MLQLKKLSKTVLNSIFVDEFKGLIKGGRQNNEPVQNFKNICFIDYYS